MNKHTFTSEILRIFFIVIICALCLIALSSCTRITASIPLSRTTGAPIATVTAWRLMSDATVSLAVPDGPAITYASRVNDTLLIGLMSQITPMLTKLNDLANSQAAQSAAAAAGYGPTNQPVPVNPVRSP